MAQATYVLFSHNEIEAFRCDRELGERIALALRYAGKIPLLPIVVPEGGCHFPLNTVIAYAGPTLDTNDAMLLEFDHGRLSRLPLDESAVVENALRRFRARKANAAKRAKKD